MLHHKEKTPLRNVLVRNFLFEKSLSLDEVARRLEEAGFFLLRPRKDVLAATSRSQPHSLLLLFLQRRAEGGELILIQTYEGRLSYTELLKHLPILEASSGLKISFGANELEDLPSLA